MPGGNVRSVRRKLVRFGMVVVLASVVPLAHASAWEDGNTAPTKTLNSDTGLSTVLDIAFDSAENLYVLNLDAGVKFVNVYQAGHFNGHPTPMKHLVIDYPGLTTSVEVDSNGNVYVSTFPVSGILVYDDITTWLEDGSTQPIKQLNYTAPLAISLDNSDNLYVVESTKVSMYDDISTWLLNGSTQPSKVLTGNNTGLSSAAAVAFDEFDNMFVSNGGNNSVTYYPANWSDGDTSPTKTLIGNNTGLDAPGSLEIDASGKMFVSSGCFLCGNPYPSGLPKVLAFAANWLGGNSAPSKTLVGTRTRLAGSSGLLIDSNGVLFAKGTIGMGVIQFAPDWEDGNTTPFSRLVSLYPTGIAFDRLGRMYVSNQVHDSITVYEANWADGNPQPIKILSGGHTGLSSPIDITFDGAGNMYVANSAGYYDQTTESSVTVYAPDFASGDTVPIRTLIGGSTGLNSPTSVALDSDGNMYVTNYSSDSVTMYAAGWVSGNTAPIKTLVGSHTGLDMPIDLAIDDENNLYVSNDSLGLNDHTDTVNVFSEGWAEGDTAPAAFLRGVDTGLNMPESLAIGSNGKIYVTNIHGDTVTAYGDFTTWAADGNTAPLKTLSGADTGLAVPWGIAFDANGNMYVANDLTVTMYAGEVPPRVTTTTTPPTTTTTTTPPTTTPPTTTPLVPEVFVLPATL